MSSLIIEVCPVERVELHPNADRMCIVTVKGWRVCAGRDPATGEDQFRPGEPCVYVPPDAILPPELSDRLGCTRYLSPLPVGADGLRPAGGRVRVARLRGEPSYGLILKPEAGMEPGQDVAARLGITKFEPPPEAIDGEGEKAHGAFHTYTDIENFRNFPDRIPSTEEVVLTEKVHGKNCRLGLIRTPGEPRSEGSEDAPEGWTFMAGSHGVRRRLLDSRGRTSQFWEVLTPPVRALLRHVATTADPAWGGGAENDVVLFGELYGCRIQDMWYGLDRGIGLRAFDLSVNGHYLDFDVKAALFARFGVEAVPVLYRGPCTREAVEAHVSGPTTLCEPGKAGKFAGREGIVVTPVRERMVQTSRHRFERLILKVISFEYLERKGGTEDH